MLKSNRVLLQAAKQQASLVSLKTQTLEADVINGVPVEHSTRTVRIYKPANTTMQSGVNNSKYWRLDFDSRPRWENPLMGWTSSGDPLQAMNIKFLSCEDAVRFAARQGYDYYVDTPKEPKFKVKAYASNFKFSADKLRRHHTK